MPTFASDSFASANGTELSAHNANWKKPTGFSASAQIANGRLRPSSTSSPVYYYDVAPGSADYSVSADITRLSSGDSNMGLLARASATANTHYRVISGSPDAFVTLGKFVGGGFTVIGSADAGLSVGNTSNVRLELIGSSLKIYINGSKTPVASYTDSSITAAGYAGVRAYSGAAPGDSVGAHLDNFLAATPGGAASPAINSITASNITQTGATITLGLTR